MKFASLGALALIASATALNSQHIVSDRPALDKWDGYTYDDFIHDYKKPLQSSAEYNLRKAIFNKNLQKIRDHNAKNASWWMTVTQFADMTEDEFSEFLGRVKPVGSTKRDLLATPLNMIHARLRANSLPSTSTASSVDNSKYLSQIRNQGKCGSCWANAAAGALEAQDSILYNRHLFVSTQQLVSCVVDPHHCGGKGGCSGSTEDKAYEYLESVLGKITTEEAYPYTSGNGDSGVCKYLPNMPSETSISSHHILTANNQKEFVETAAAPNVFTVSVAASSWALYGGGIFTGCTDRGDFVTNHAVVLTGYSDDYYTIVNSWGPNWGENGYIRLMRRKNNDEVCGINNKPWDGSACDGDTDPIIVCGECGVLSESTLVEIA